jgi:RNA 3'-phosphate cyclase
MLEIDASYGEGGGQLLRTAVALAAITGTPVQLHHIRAGRARPGLAPQHLAAVRAVAQVCGAQLEPLELGAQELCFVPAALRAGTYEFDIGTAGSITLLLQALLPVLLRAPGPSEVVLRGGTDVRAAPPLDYFAHVLLRLLRPIGVQVQLQELRRGYFPRGGGLVRLHVTPEPLRALRLDSAGALTAVYGAAHVANLPAHIAERMRGAAQQHLAARGIPLHIETRVLGSTQAAGMGGALVLWAQTAHSTLGAARVAERGLRAEDIGTSVATELLADLDSGATVDVHAADQLLIYTALAEGESHYRTRELSRHAQTAIWLIEHFLPQRFRTEVRGRTVAITVGPA